ncbi:MAG: glycosyltransferase family 4 protein [Desulfobacula sp.]|nr:glycosyltransferase family 4 protein [Desulfobacula sp.]
MNILVYTNLFPNTILSSHGIFTLKRMGHFNQLKDCHIKVIAPVPYCPSLPFIGKWYPFFRIKKFEIIEGIEVYHPRYLLIPKISMLFHGLSMFLGSISTIKKINKTFKFDIIDSHFVYPDGFSALLLSKIMKKPLVVSALGSDIHEFTKFRFIRLMIQYTLNSATQVITVCDALKQDMVRLKVAHTKIHVIPSGVDTKRFHPLSKQEARRKLQLTEEGKIILSVGSLIPLKGFQTIIESLSRHSSFDKNLCLYIIGEGPYKSKLKQLVKESGLEKRVIFVGQRPNSELPLWYNAADVFCLASFREGWPNVVMESLACGTPVVATRVFGIPEILTSPEMGILVEPNSESVASGLMKALTTTWEKEKIASFMKKRTWLHIATDIQMIFKQILTQSISKPLKDQ